MTASVTAAWAESYAAVGWRVFPIRPGDKRPPAAFRWSELASTDSDRINRWFRDETWNLAVACDAFDVFDIEGEHMPLFLSWMRTVGHSLPMTPVARTGGGGVHILVQPLGRGGGQLMLAGRKIGDLKSRGGYIVVSPSCTPMGQYAWLYAPAGMPVAEAPDWLRALVPEPVPAAPVRSLRSTRDAERLLAGLARGVSRADPGDRNKYLFWAARRAAEHGIPLRVAGRVLEGAAVDLRASDGERAIAATVRSAYRKTGTS